MATKTKTTAPATEPEAPTTALATVGGNQSEVALALANAGIDFGADAAEFVDDYRREDFAMPFLYVLQKGSPQVDETHTKFIEGAKQGMLLNTATKELIDCVKGQLVLVVAHYRKTFIAWVLRDEGGGFIADVGLDEGLKLLATCVKGPKGENLIPNTHPQQQLVETMQFTLAYRSKVTGDVTPALLTLTSTQLKKGRDLNTKIDSLRVEYKGKKIRPPMFYQAWALKTAVETKDKNSWQGVNFTAFAPAAQCEENGTGVELYLAARQLRESIDSGAIRLDKAAEAQSHNEVNPDSEPDNGFDNTGGEKTPF